MDLSKPDKKIARALIDKGLNIAYENALEDAHGILNDWKSKKADTKSSYMDLYKNLHLHDKSIGMRYNDLGGSRYFTTVWNLFAEGVLDENDIEGFSDEVRNRLFALKPGF